MSKNENRDLQRVLDILHAIKLIYSFIEHIDFERFYKSDLFQSAVIHQFQVIGEASDKVTLSTKTDHDNVPWRSIKSFRNLLIHEYFKVDAAEVWATIKNDLPELEEQMQHVFKELQKK